MWTMVLGLAVLAVIVSLVWWWQARGQQTDMGSVSDHWVSEQRLSQKQDSQR